MPLAAFAIFVVLSVESWKASSRVYYRRKSRKHGYADLPTDAYGRPVNDRGERLSRNQAKALIAHNRELERIKTAEREWRLEGEKLPNYEEARSASIREALRRPSTAQPGATRSVNRRIAGSRATSWGGTPTPLLSSSRSSSGYGQRTSVTARNGAAGADAPVGSAVAFAIRRNGPNLAVIQSRDSSLGTDGAAHAVGLTASVSAPLEELMLDDVIENDGMDWQRATWEGSPIYAEIDRSATLPSITMATGGVDAATTSLADTLDRQPSRLVI
ncbi:uncharacterized protein PFL1_05917 [Pseudozyma flocculosa PF-1]|uniref:Uncharacterized protein n=2 Tax=Pseudozyma flocculosa TaxID=84751 RepID=A0A5C3F4S2_9BASI|nr:uncharacterized protein PFL1_05917 [Pseudozyma flocculosa PF-1]EPQ26596.1 hypothetical protein PFL1_05917 [Pseudozyma flocculosa PF-1]SPO38409.1 uncharacterized protein PSFLO_03887 [Pseudozyma flocculosa]